MNRLNTLCVCAVAGVGALIAAVSFLDQPGRGLAPTPGVAVAALPAEGSAPYTIWISGFSVPMSPEELAYRAHTAVVGEVVAVSGARWSTASGKAPEGWTPGSRLPQPEVIYRSVTVRVVDVFQRASDDATHVSAGATVNVAVLGGSVGGVRMAIEEPSAPEITVGAQVALFLYRPPEWRLGEQNVGLLQGYTVKDGVATHPQLGDIRLDELTSRTRAEVERRAAGAVEPAN